MASSIEARDISRRRGAGAQLRREEDPANRAFTGGDALVKTLLDHGVDTAFGVPGRATSPSSKRCGERRIVSASSSRATSPAPPSPHALTAGWRGSPASLS